MAKIIRSCHKAQAIIYAGGNNSKYYNFQQAKNSSGNQALVKVTISSPKPSGYSLP